MNVFLQAWILISAFITATSPEPVQYKHLPKPVGSNGDSIFVELLIVMDSNLVHSRYHELEKTHQRLRLLATHLNHVMQPLNVFVYLNSRQVLNAHHHLNITSGDTPKEALLKFSKFIIESKNHLGVFDHAMLISGSHFRDQEGDVQLSFLGGICWLDSSVSLITEHQQTDDIRLLAAAMAYALARNLGIEDDYNDRSHECFCAKRPCLMSSFHRLSPVVEWSSCSKDFLKRARLLGRHYCLSNAPRVALAKTPKKTTPHYRDFSTVKQHDVVPTGNVSTVDGDVVYDSSGQQIERHVVVAGYGSGEETSTTIMAPVEVRSFEATETVTSRCGNGFVEPGEQCDCGLPEFCSPSAMLCCDPFTCKLTQNATCASGDCCDLNTCQLKTTGVICRQAANECDLPEYCSGRNESCPVDVYKQSGTPCLNDALCHEGKCRSLDMQCQRIFGETAFAAAAPFWFANLSPLSSDEFGCGNGVACANDSDIECGRLFCQHEAEKPVLFYAPPHWREDSPISGPLSSNRRVFGIARPPGGGSTNLSLFVTHRTETRAGNRAVREAAYVVLNPMPGTEDPSFVEDGTPCGTLPSGEVGLAKGICMNRICVFDRPYRKCNSQETCSGHGVCNSVDSCHCDPGFSPPFCNTSGIGGSLHSGPPPTLLPIDSIDDDSSATIALTIALVVFIVVCSSLLVLAIFFRRKLQIWYYSNIWAAPGSRVPSFLANKNSVIRLNLSKVQRKWGTSLAAAAAATSTPSSKRDFRRDTTTSEPQVKNISQHTPKRSFRGLEISTPVLKHSTLTKEKLDSLMPLNAVIVNATLNPEATSLMTSDAVFTESDDEKMVSPDLIQSTYLQSSSGGSASQDDTTQQASDDEPRQCTVPKRPAPRTPQQNRLLVKVSFSVPERLNRSKPESETDSNNGDV